MSSISWVNATNYQAKTWPAADTQHGTRSRAKPTRKRPACSCVACQRVNTVYQRALRGSVINHDRKLQVECWCQAKVVHVSEVEIRAGITRSCMSPECRAIARSEAARRQREQAA